jgi:hypothetical protein
MALEYADTDILSNGLKRRRPIGMIVKNGKVKNPPIPQILASVK